METKAVYPEIDLPAGSDQAPAVGSVVTLKDGDQVQVIRWLDGYFVGGIVSDISDFDLVSYLNS